MTVIVYFLNLKINTSLSEIQIFTEFVSGFFLVLHNSNSISVYLISFPFKTFTVFLVYVLD